MNSLSSNSRKDFAKGIGVFQKEADAFSELRSRIDGDLQKAKDLTKNFINLNIEAKKAGLTREEKRLALQEAAQARKPIERETESLNALKASLLEKKQQLEAIQSTLPNDDKISTGVGVIFGASIANGFADLGALAALGTLAGTQNFQRAVAGQTALQQAGARGIKKITPAAEALRKATQIGAVAAESSAASLNEQLTTARIGTPSAKASMYRKLYSSGRLDRLRSINPQAFQSLQQAFESLQ